MKVSILVLLLLVFSNVMICQEYERVKEDQYVFTFFINSKVPKGILKVFLDTTDNQSLIRRMEYKRRGEDSIIQEIELGHTTEYFDEHSIEITDENHDGYNDITILYNQGNHESDYDVWLYNPKTNKYDYSEEFGNLKSFRN